MKEFKEKKECKARIVALLMLSQIFSLAGKIFDETKPSLSIYQLSWFTISKNKIVQQQITLLIITNCFSRGLFFSQAIQKIDLIWSFFDFLFVTRNAIDWRPNLISDLFRFFRIVRSSEDNLVFAFNIINNKIRL